MTDAPPRDGSGDEDEERALPPILHPGKKQEVIATIVRIVGGLLISAVVLYSILLSQGIFTFTLFLTLFFVESKDSLVTLIAYLTGAKAEDIKEAFEQYRKARSRDMERRREEWEDEKEQLRQMMAEINIEKAHVEAELQAEREIRQSMERAIQSLKE